MSFYPDSLEIIDKPPIIATAVDPCYHQLQCFSNGQRALIYETVKEKLEEMTPNTTEGAEPAQKKKEFALSFLVGENYTECNGNMEFH